jgi:hypothetical protein
MNLRNSHIARSMPLQSAPGCANGLLRVALAGLVLIAAFGVANPARARADDAVKPAPTKLTIAKRAAQDIQAAQGKSATCAACQLPAASSAVPAASASIDLLAVLSTGLALHPFRLDAPLRTRPRPPGRCTARRRWDAIWPACAAA